MNQPLSTCWTVIRGAADGRDPDRDAFARRYAPAVRAYLAARWRGTGLVDTVEDAVQEVFLDCFRKGGALDRADEERPGGFRAFLYGVARIVALRLEKQRNRRREQPDPEVLDPERLPADDPTLSRVYDRTWATTVMREVADLQADRAREAGGDVLRRVELLHLRFYEGLPIRDIAKQWDTDAAELHREYAKARREFHETLREVVAFHHPGKIEGIDRECVHLLALLRRE